MDKHKALKSLIQLTNTNLGCIPSTPTEFNYLSHKIQQRTGQSLSPSSIKRLWGYVVYASFPSLTTLNILSQFNGFTDWKAFTNSLYPNESNDDSGFLVDSLANTGKISAGERLALSWDADKSCELECITDKRFRVKKSHNIKLQEGDMLTLHTISIGHPIYVSDIVRGEEHIEGYIGAKKGGLRRFKILHPE